MRQEIEEQRGKRLLFAGNGHTCHGDDLWVTDCESLSGHCEYDLSRHRGSVQLSEARLSPIRVTKRRLNPC